MAKEVAGPSGGVGARPIFHSRGSVTGTALHLHLVSDEAGVTLSVAQRAASSLWPGIAIYEHTHPLVLSRDSLGGILKEIERNPGIALYSLRDPVIVRDVKEACAAIGCRSLAMPKPNAGTNAVSLEPALNSAIRLQLTRAPRTFFKAALGIYAGMLAIQSLWMLSIALIRPPITFPPPDSATARTTANKEGAAHAAALMGIIRGDLWADYAFSAAAAALDASTESNQSNDTRPLDIARQAAERAAKLAPHQSSIWLLLATLDTQIDGNNVRVAQELKTSYYTGPNESALRPLRIRVAVASNAIADKDLQFLVVQELRAIVEHDPDLKQAIVNAYRHGSPNGRRFLENALAELDPQLADTMHKG